MNLLRRVRSLKRFIFLLLILIIFYLIFPFIWIKFDDTTDKNSLEQFVQAEVIYNFK